MKIRTMIAEIKISVKALKNEFNFPEHRTKSEQIENTREKMRDTEK